MVNSAMQIFFTVCSLQDNRGPMSRNLGKIISAASREFVEGLACGENKSNRNYLKILIVEVLMYLHCYNLYKTTLTHLFLTLVE